MDLNRINIKGPGAKFGQRGTRLSFQGIIYLGSILVSYFLESSRQY